MILMTSADILGLDSFSVATDHCYNSPGNFGSWNPCVRNKPGDTCGTWRCRYLVRWIDESKYEEADDSICIQLDPRCWGFDREFTTTIFDRNGNKLEEKVYKKETRGKDSNPTFSLDSLSNGEL